MVMTDPIADMLTRIRNGNTVYHEKVDVPASKLKQEVARILLEEGFVKNVEHMQDKAGHPVIRLFLKYGSNKERVITGLKRISRPGLRVYAAKDEVPRVLGGMGIAIISTSHGIMTDKKARQAGVGGEILCYVW